jgi:hypothetical protein
MNVGTRWKTGHFFSKSNKRRAAHQDEIPPPPNFSAVVVRSWPSRGPGCAISSSATAADRTQLVAIAADIAGYSRIMGADEEGTLAKLKAYRRELDDTQFP